MKSLNHGDSLVPAAEVIEAATPILTLEDTLKQDSGGFVDWPDRRALAPA